MSVMKVASDLAAGRVSSVEVTQGYLAHIKETNPTLNALITVTEEAALKGARAADAQRARGEAGFLTGVPVVHKDLFCTNGVRTTCASRMLENFVAPYDATVVQRLDAAGMVLLGKANMDEFAMGSSNENSYFGPAANPWNQDHVAGGSSGGSAAAVAGGMTPVATGTDTGGSIRQPSAFCGVTGLKPTYGRVSRWGMIAFASSLDQGGPIAHSAADLAPVYAAMAGHDDKDSTSVPRAAEELSEFAAGEIADPQPLTIGLPEQYFAALPAGEQAYEAVRRTLEAAGHRIADVSLPHTDVAIPTYYVISGAEASTNLSRYDGVRFGYRAEGVADLAELYTRSRSDGFGSEVKRRILTGTYALSIGYYDAYYRKAQSLRRLIQSDFLSAFDDVDVLLTPTTPNAAFARDTLNHDPVAMYAQDIFTTPASLAGLPAISVPCGFSGDLPIGVQFIAAHFAEGLLLKLAHQYQSQTDWHTQRAEIAA